MENTQKNQDCLKQLERECEKERAEFLREMDISLIKNFFAWEEGSKGVISVSVACVGITKEIESGMLLNQIINYYYLFRMQHEHDTELFGFFEENYYWISYGVFLDDCRRLLFLKKPQFIKAFDILMQKALINKKMFNNLLCIRLNWARFLEELEVVTRYSNIGGYIGYDISYRMELKKEGALVTLVK